MTHRNTRRGNTQKAVNNNRHSRMSLSGIPSTADKQGGDPRLQASGMTASWITTRGFTLIELLVVVLIIGILVAVAIPQYQKAVIKTRIAEYEVHAKTLAQATDAYYLENGSYPKNLSQLDIDIPSCNRIPGIDSECKYVVGSTIQVVFSDIMPMPFFVYQTKPGWFDTTETYTLICVAWGSFKPADCQRLGFTKSIGTSDSPPMYLKP